MWPNPKPDDDLIDEDNYRYQTYKNISPKLMMDILITPLIFYWALFQKGYSPRTRIVALVYLVLAMLYFLLGTTIKEYMRPNPLSSPP